MVVAVPKKQARGACEVDNFCGVSLSSTVCKVMCRQILNRLSGVVKEKGLLAEEQGGFQKELQRPRVVIGAVGKDGNAEEIIRNHDCIH